MLVSAMLILLLSASCALAWPVENLTISPGEDLCVDSGPITIEGDVGPGDYVPITTTYVVEVPVIDGKYEYKQDNVPIPPGTTATIKAEGVQDLTITTNILGFDLSKTFAASAGIASVSTPVPKGNYNLVVSGNAAGASGAVTNCYDEGTDQTIDKVEKVKLTFIAFLEVKADKTGHFVQECCTERPAGEYTLKVKDKTRVVTLRDCSNGQIDGIDEGFDDEDVNSAIPDAENKVTTSSNGGTGSAKIVVSENVPSENITALQAMPETNAEVAADIEDVKEEPVINKNSIIDYIWKILNWLGF